MDVVTLGAARADAKRTYAPVARRPYVAGVGDSIIAKSAVLDGGSAPSPAYYANGWIEWARAINGAPFSVVGPSATQYTYATGGYTTTQMISAGYHTGAAASNASVVVVLAGTNDLGGSSTGSILANLQTIWTTLRNAGKLVIACTLLPRSDQAANVVALNAAIKTAVAATPGMVLLDLYPLLLDPSTGGLASAYGEDAVHPNAAGAYIMGQRLATLLATLLAGGDPLDVFHQAAANQITKNPFATGDSAGLPTNWSKFNLGSGTSVASKVARTDGMAGEWCQLVVTAPTPNTDGAQLQAAQVSAKWSVGDTLYGIAEVNVTSGYDLRGLFVYAYGGNTDNQTYVGYYGPTTKAALTTGMPASGKLRLITPPLTVTNTATSFSMNVQVYGAGTIQVGRFGVIKV